jgi:nucleoside-diphosphate-sugar epimerase
MTKQIRVLVTGAGGFIGHHLVKYLEQHGYWVRGVDIKEPEYEQTTAHEFNPKQRTAGTQRAVSMRCTASPQTWVA